MWMGQPYLVPEAAVIHGGQAVVDGGGPVMVEGLAGRLSLQVAVLQRLHHGLGHLTLNLTHDRIGMTSQGTRSTFGRQYT